MLAATWYTLAGSNATRAGNNKDSVYLNVQQLNMGWAPNRIGTDGAVDILVI